MTELILKDFKWSSLMIDFAITDEFQSIEYDLNIEFYNIYSEMLDFEPCLISISIDNEQIKLSGSISFSLSEYGEMEGEEYPSDLYGDEAKRFVDDLEFFLKERYNGDFVVTLSNSCLSFDAKLTEK
jgi:hypothetical protein